MHDDRATERKDRQKTRPEEKGRDSALEVENRKLDGNTTVKKRWSEEETGTCVDYI